MFKYLNKLFDWMSLDGALHILCSLVILLVLAVFFPLWASVCLTCVVGLGKEVYDRLCGSGFSWKDLLCDAAGMAIGIIIVLLFKHFCT